MVSEEEVNSSRQTWQALTVRLDGLSKWKMDYLPLEDTSTRTVSKKGALSTV